MNQEISEQDIEAARKLFAGPCDFMKGVVALDGLPDADLPELAFAGRSNVGKSSLVNALTGRNTLARTSNTPGRTQELNYFNLGGVLYLVDMPGYGYAKVSKDKIAAWTALIRAYLRGRPSLRCVLIMVDARHGLKSSDSELMGMLDEAGVSYRIILTKADKVKEQALTKVKFEVEAALAKHPAAFPSASVTSAHKETGIAELRAVIASYQ